jgi:hypothetical protein
MLKNLYDDFSLMFYRRWPKAEGKITAVDICPGTERDVVIVYEFSVGDDGPYTGESSRPFSFEGTTVMDIERRLSVGKPVLIRYRIDNPSINKLDPSFWKNLIDF